MNDLCSMELLRNAVARRLSVDEEATLHTHLEQCEACCVQMEQLVGGEAWQEEAAALLSADELDAAVPETAVWSEVDFSVEHLDPSDDANVLGQLGGYDVLAIVGRGGMGVVLKAFDRELKRLVAIKVLAPHLAHSSVARKRFAREAQAAAAVVDPHVIAIHHVQPTGRLPFLIMPLLTGESLAQRLKARGPLELTEVLRIGMQAAAGLSAAHDQGLVHRDVKPANIFLEKGVERVVLTDFGLARAADDVSMTRWGVVAGTPEYMSPEQARGEALDGRSDLFSLGCVLYEMATGVSPFRTDSTMATLRRIVDEQPAAMASLVPELPPWFCHIVERLLSKDPAQRFASASEVSQLLEQCLSHLQQPTSVPLPCELQALARDDYRFGFLTGMFRWRRNWKIIGGIALLMLIGSASFFGVLGVSEKDAKKQSEKNLTQLSEALHQYRKAHDDRFPPAVIHGSDGKGGPPHSWRVALLPYLGHQDLYDVYRFDEPWDSTHNKSLLARIPDVYRAPFDDSTNASYFGVVLKGHSKPQPISLGVAAQPGPSLPQSEPTVAAPAPNAETIMQMNPFDASRKIRQADRKRASDVIAIAERSLRDAQELTEQAEQRPPDQQTPQRWSTITTQMNLYEAKARVAELDGKPDEQLQHLRRVLVLSGELMQQTFNSEYVFLTKEATSLHLAPQMVEVRVRMATIKQDVNEQIKYLDDLVQARAELARRARDAHMDPQVAEQSAVQAREWLASARAAAEHIDATQTIFSSLNGMRYGGIPDGAANTIALVEAKHAVPWTKPEDIVFDPQSDALQLGGWYRGGWFTAFADLSVRWFSNETDPAKVRNLLTVSDFDGGAGMAPAIELPLDRQNARAVVEALVSAAFSRDEVTFNTLARLRDRSEAGIEALCDDLKVARLPIQSVYVNDLAKPTRALATSEAVRLEGKKPTQHGQRESLLMFTLTMSDEGWLVTDIDFESKESADRELKAFLDANPKSIGSSKPGLVSSTPAAVMQQQAEIFDTPPGPAATPDLKAGANVPVKPSEAGTPKRPKLPDDAYAMRGVHWQKFREEDAKRPGGELMGAVLEPSKPEDRNKERLVLGVRTASDAQWRIGGTAKVGLVVRNRTGDIGRDNRGSDVKFSYTGRLDNGLSVVAVDEAGKEHGATIAQFDALLIFQQMLLPVAHVATIKMFTIRFDAEKRDVSEPFVAAFHLPPGKYKLRCTWDDARPEVAHEGEWTGELVNEEFEFTLAAAVADPPPASEAPVEEPAAEEKPAPAKPAPAKPAADDPFGEPAFETPAAPAATPDSKAGANVTAKPTRAGTPKLLKLTDDAYAKLGVHCQKFREEDAKRPGGELMGAVREPSKPEDRNKEPLVLGVRTASDAQWRIGGTAKVSLVVRNRTGGIGRNQPGSDVKFSYTGRIDNGLSVVAVDEAGKEHGATIAQFDGELGFQHMLLPVAHVATLKEFTLRFDAKKRDVSEPFVAAFHLPPGKYKLRCKWDDAHPDVSHEGEWTGELSNEELEFTLAAAPAPVAENPRSTIEAYLAAALSGNVSKAVTLATKDREAGSESTLQDLKTMLAGKKIKVPTVSMGEKNGRAIAVTDEVKIAEPNPDGRNTGRLVFHLVKPEDKWLVDDIDFDTDRKAQEQVAKFKKENPDAKFFEANPKAINTDIPENQKAKGDSDNAWLQHRLEEKPQVAKGVTDDLRLGQSYKIKLLVLGSDDLKPVAGATVDVTLIRTDSGFSGDGGFADFKTDADGIATIDNSLWPGRYQIRVRAPKNSRYRNTEFSKEESILVVHKDGRYSPREFRLVVDDSGKREGNQQGSEQPALSKTLQQLQGKWRLTRQIAADGDEKSTPGNSIWEFKGDRIIVRDGGPGGAMLIQVDESHSPVHVEMVIETEEESGLGLLSIEDDTLIVCLGKSHKTPIPESRPKKLQWVSGVWYMKLQRVKPGETIVPLKPLSQPQPQEALSPRASSTIPPQTNVDDTGKVVLHAIDADTGKPIRDVVFVKENLLREDWALPVGSSDADGLVRIDVKPLPGYFFSILPVPRGYKLTSLDEVPAKVKVGGRVDYRFHLRKEGTNLDFVKEVPEPKSAGNRFAGTLKDSNKDHFQIVMDDMPGFLNKSVTISFARKNALLAERIFANGELVRAAVQDELRYFQKAEGKLAGDISELSDIKIVANNGSLARAPATSWYLYCRTKDGIELKQDGFAIRFEDLDHWDLEIPAFLHPEF